MIRVNWQCKLNQSSIANFKSSRVLIAKLVQIKEQQLCELPQNSLEDGCSRKLSIVGEWMISFSVSRDHTQLLIVYACMWNGNRTASVNSACDGVWTRRKRTETSPFYYYCMYLLVDANIRFDNEILMLSCAIVMNANIFISRECRMWLATVHFLEILFTIEVSTRKFLYYFGHWPNFRFKGCNSYSLNIWTIFFSLVCRLA